MTDWSRAGSGESRSLHLLDNGGAADARSGDIRGAGRQSQVHIGCQLNIDDIHGAVLIEVAGVESRGSHRGTGCLE
jgi:hypothetical protein